MLVVDGFDDMRLLLLSSDIGITPAPLYAPILTAPVEGTELPKKSFPPLFEMQYPVFNAGELLFRVKAFRALLIPIGAFEISVILGLA